MQLTDELWRDIVGFDGKYQVSNLGRIRSIEHISKCSNQHTQFYRTYPSKILKLHAIDRGYLQAFLYKDGKSMGYLVHRLVAMAFLPNPYDKLEVNHKDRNPSNNCIHNLEWVTKEENIKHALNNGWNPKLSRLGHKNSSEHIQAVINARSGTKANEDLINKLRNSHIHQSKRCKCVTTNEEFLSLAEASRAFNLDPTSISEAIKKNRKVKGKYIFTFV